MINLTFGYKITLMVRRACVNVNVFFFFRSVHENPTIAKFTRSEIFKRIAINRALYMMMCIFLLVEGERSSFGWNSRLKDKLEIKDCLWLLFVIASRFRILRFSVIILALSQGRKVQMWL